MKVELGHHFGVGRLERLHDAMKGGDGGSAVAELPAGNGGLIHSRQLRQLHLSDPLPPSPFDHVHIDSDLGSQYDQYQSNRQGTWHDRMGGEAREWNFIRNYVNSVKSLE
jgi:hypothetical protein